jgi:hypothetical protein
MLFLHTKFSIMKKLLLLPVIALFAACGGNTDKHKDEKPGNDTSLSYFGDTITGENAADVATVLTSLKGKDSLALKLTGTITSVCQKKGCWMEMDLGKGQTMRVTFKDYAFFVPKDADGKTAIIEGYAYNDTISVEELKHYAEDAGKSKEEIEKITAPEVELSFEAKGVIIKE